MALKTIKDFDFGVGGNIRLTQRISESPSDVSKMEVDFIVWLMLEHEFMKSKKRHDIPIQQGNSRRTQFDGLHDEDDGDDIDRPLASRDPTRNEKIQIAREYAEDTLRSQGFKILWEDLVDEDREGMILQLCRQNCDFFQMSSTVQSVPEIFRCLRSSKFYSQFSVKQRLDKGGFGEVFLVCKEGDESNTEYAVKKITPYESLEDVRAAINESKILKKLKGHRNIVEIFDYWLEIEPGGAENIYVPHNSVDDDFEEGPLKFYIQLEFCGASLEAWKESNHKRGLVPEKSQIVNIALQLFDGLAHIHAHKILHLDINPKNILWKDPTCTLLKIVDFGLAREAISHNTKDGTVGYIAPELPLTHKSDVFSASVTIVEVAKTIYTKQQLSETIQSRPISTGIPALDELLTLALEENPSCRPSAVYIKDTLSKLKD